MSWYNDKAIKNIDARLVLESAGAGAKALGHLAKIPLDIEARKAKNNDVAQQAYLAKLKSDTSLTVAQKRAEWEKYKSNNSLEARKVSAGASYHASNVRSDGNAKRDNANKRDNKTSRANNIRTTDVNHDKNQNDIILNTMNNYSKKEVQKIKNKGVRKMPTIKTVDIKDDVTTTITKEYVPHGDFDIEAQKKKKLKNMAKIDLGLNK